MSKIELYIWVIIATTILLFVTGVFVVLGYLPIFYRSFKFREIARKYSFRLSKDVRFDVKKFFTVKYKFNVLEGEVNDKKIVIYDKFSLKDYANSTGLRETVIEIDGKSERIRGGLFGYSQIHDISELVRLLIRNEDYSHLVTHKSSGSISDSQNALWVALIFFLALTVFLLIMFGNVEQ